MLAWLTSGFRILCLLLLASCATFEGPANTPIVHDSNPIGPLATPEIGGDTAVALAFSGGGTRAAAFAYGVLRGLKDMPTKDGKNYLEQVVFFRASLAGLLPRPTFGLKGTSELRRLTRTLFASRRRSGVEH